MSDWQPSTFTPDSSPDVALGQTTSTPGNLPLAQSLVNQQADINTSDNPDNAHPNAPAWQPSTFTPDVPSVQSQQSRQPDQILHDASPSGKTDYNTPETFRQIGLAGRDIAGAVPMSLAGLGDYANKGINAATGMVNKYEGTNIPPLGMPTDAVQKGLTAIGFPEPQNKVERGVQDTADLMLGGGEGALNNAKAVAQNAWSTLKGAPQVTADMLKKAASSVYQSSRDAGVVFNDDAAQSVSQAMQDAMTAGGKMNARLHPLATGLQEDFNSQLENGNLGLDDLEQHRQLLNQAIDKDTDAFGKVGPDGNKLIAAKRGLDNWVKTMDPTTALQSGDPDAINMLTNYARPTWAQATKLQDVERVMNRAQMMDNPTTAMKTGFRNLALSAKSNGYSDEEYAALDKAARTGLGVDTLRVFGSRLIPIISSGAGGLSGGFPGYVAGNLGAQGVSTLSRNTANFLQTRKAQKLANIIAQGSPLKPAANASSLSGGSPDLGGALGLAGGAEAADESPKQQERGGAINKAKGGAVYPRPKSYPALQRYQ